MLQGGKRGAGIAAAHDAAMHTELQRAGPIEEVRPFQANLDQFAFNESVGALEEQAGASHVGKLPAAAFPGPQGVLKLQTEGKTMLLTAPVASSGARHGAQMREVSPVQGRLVRAIRIVKTRPLERGRGFERIVSAYQRF